MGCMTKNPAVRRFYLRVAATNSAYVVLSVLVCLYFYKFRPHGPLAYFLAALPAAAIIAVIVTFGLYVVEEKDEFQRNLFIQVLLCGLGGVLVVTSVWGWLETLVHIWHFQPLWTYMVFWIFAGISAPFLLRKYQ